MQVVSSINSAFLSVKESASYNITLDDKSEAQPWRQSELFLKEPHFNCYTQDLVCPQLC